MSPERDKREILINSPFLTTFLNERLSQRPDLWSAALGTASQPLKDELKEKVGLNWEPILVAALAGLAYTFEIFREDDAVHKRGLAGALGTLFLIGYEVGNLEEAALFHGEINKQFFSLELLKTEVDDRKEYADRVARFIVGALQAGVLLRNKLDPSSKNAPDTDTPQVFREFIEGLNLENI